MKNACGKIALFAYKSNYGIKTKRHFFNGTGDDGPTTATVSQIKQRKEEREKGAHKKSGN